MHNDTGVQCLGCRYKCRRSDTSPLNKCSRYPGSFSLRIQRGSGRNSRWLRSDSGTEDLCKGCSRTRPHPGCSWSPWGRLGSGRWICRCLGCRCSWRTTPLCRRRRARHSGYPRTTRATWGTDTRIRSGCQGTCRHCYMEMRDTCPLLLCTTGLKWRTGCRLKQEHSRQ